MSNITNTDAVVTESKLKDFYEDIKPFLGYAVGAGGGFAPIGTINFFDAVSAPSDWLACDGSTYNIADYPQLAEWYELQHGSKNFYGGDGTITFAVPDLQGEFLRGAGTNSHSTTLYGKTLTQGDGANVGVHQDATGHPAIYTTSGNLIGRKQDGGSNGINPTYYDSSITSDTYAKVATTNGSSNSIAVYTSRPTNTSFLICVKAKDRGEVYSLDEQRVGTWIDGKPLYQKTFEGRTPSTLNTAENFCLFNNGEIFENIIIVDGFSTDEKSTPTYTSIQGGNGNSSWNVWANPTAIRNKFNDSTRLNNKAWITIRYTKKTD